MAEVKEVAVPAVTPPAEERYPDGSLIKKGAAGTEFWPTEAKALEIAKGRPKGARLAFTVKDKAGKVRWATATHHHYLEEYLVCTELGYEVTEIGKVATTRAPQTADSLIAAANSMPEAERDAILKQIETMLKAKAAAAKGK